MGSKLAASHVTNYHTRAGDSHTVPVSLDMLTLSSRLSESNRLSSCRRNNVLSHNILQWIFSLRPRELFRVGILIELRKSPAT
jgi:hypothetical protein